PKRKRGLNSNLPSLALRANVAHSAPGIIRANRNSAVDCARKPAGDAMFERVLRRLLFSALACAAMCATSIAAPPWSKLAMFKHLEADPHETYPISEENGPWMIMATSFTGEGAEDQAQQLIHE